MGGPVRPNKSPHLAPLGPDEDATSGVTIQDPDDPSVTLTHPPSPGTTTAAAGHTPAGSTSPDEWLERQIRNMPPSLRPRIEPGPLDAKSSASPPGFNTSALGIASDVDPETATIATASGTATLGAVIRNITRPLDSATRTTASMSGPFTAPLTVPVEKDGLTAYLDQLSGTTSTLLPGTVALTSPDGRVSRGVALSPAGNAHILLFAWIGGIFTVNAIDSGADVTAISPANAAQLGLSVYPTSLRLTSCDASSLRCVGYVDTVIEVDCEPSSRDSQHGVDPLTTAIVPSPPRRQPSNYGW